jgi:hypothetical protein
LNRVRQGYIEMESPHPVLHHVAHGFSLAPARHSDGLSIQVSGHGVRTGGASHPHLCRHALAPNIWSTAATCARCTRSRDTPIRRWSGVMSTWLCAVSLGHGSFWRRGKAWGNARGDQRSDRSGRDVRQDNSEVRRGSHRTAGAILVIARIRLTRTIRANTVVGAKHPIPVVPQTHEGRQRMFRPYRGSQ